jgi:hypothetical protein
MALFLLHRVNASDRNSSAIHSCIVEAADEAAARSAAIAAAPDGETRVRATWAAVSLGSGTIPVSLPSTLFFEGDSVTTLGRRRGS